MFRLDPTLKVYLHREAVDFRKNINGLSALVEQSLGLDPFARAVYVFRNRRADRIKLLGWDRNGFWLLLKRLEQDRFSWPREADGRAVALAARGHRPGGSAPPSPARVPTGRVR